MAMRITLGKAGRRQQCGLGLREKRQRLGQPGNGWSLGAQERASGLAPVACPGCWAWLLGLDLDLDLELGADLGAGTGAGVRRSGAPPSGLNLTRFPGRKPRIAGSGLPCGGEESLERHFALGREKLPERRLFSASHNVHSRFRANGQGGATFFYNSHLPI